MLTKDNFVLYAMKAYDNPSCKTLIEFENDVSKFQFLARLCSREMGEIETNLLLNYVMALLNSFKTVECITMMFFKIREEDHYKIKTILVFLERMPTNISDISINVDGIEICQNMMITLNKI